MKTNQKGFSIVEVLVVLVIAGLIGVIGWLAYERQKNKTAQNSQDIQKHAQLAQASERISQADPYAEWKTYCDDKAALCFKYPLDWTIDSSYDSQRNAASAIVTSKNQKARVMYASNYVKDGGIRDVTPSVLENAKGLKGFSLAGTYSLYLNRHTVVYDIVGGTVEESGYKVGQATKSLDNPRFEHGGTSYKLSGWPLKDATTSADFASADEAKQWFSSDEGKTVALIIQSFAKK